MKKFLSLASASLLLISCIPAEIQNPGSASSSSTASGPLAGSSSSRGEILIEIEDSSSSPMIATGTGSLSERVTAHGILEIGNADAPQILTVFTNYGCAYCEEFMREMLPRLETDFLRPGTLRLQIVNTPFKKYPNSSFESTALLCAAALEKGLVFHEAITEAGLRDRKSVLSLIKKLEIPTKEFTTCLGAKETKNLLEEQQAFIHDNTVTLIPTFMIGDHRITGLPSYSDLRGWVREKLQ